MHPGVYARGPVKAHASRPSTHRGLRDRAGGRGWEEGGFDAGLGALAGGRGSARSHRGVPLPSHTRAPPDTHAGDVKKRAARIVGNLGALINDPKDMAPYGSLLLPDIQARAESEGEFVGVLPQGAVMDVSPSASPPPVLPVLRPRWWTPCPRCEPQPPRRLARWCRVSTRPFVQLFVVCFAGAAIAGVHAQPGGAPALHRPPPTHSPPAYPLTHTHIKAWASPALRGCSPGCWTACAPSRLRWSARARRRGWQRCCQCRGQRRSPRSCRRSWRGAARATRVGGVYVCVCVCCGGGCERARCPKHSARCQACSRGPTSRSSTHLHALPLTPNLLCGCSRARGPPYALPLPAHLHARRLLRAPAAGKRGSWHGIACMCGCGCACVYVKGA